MDAKTIRITFDAARTVIRQTRYSAVETGGILLGILDPEIMIVAAGCPGENAIRCPTQFTSDPEADQVCLDNARSEYGDCIGPVGWWHKHPAGLSRPSGGDLEQMRRLAGEYADGKPIVAGIVSQTPGMNVPKMALSLYSIAGRSELIEHDWQLIQSHGRQLRQILRIAPHRPDIQTGGFWMNGAFQSYLNPIGRDRIKTEIAALKAMGWDVTTGRRPHDHTMVLKLTRNLIFLEFVLPPEFPLNPPVLYTKAGRQLHSLDTLAAWSSLHDLSEVVREAMDVMRCPKCMKRHLDDSVSHTIGRLKGAGNNVK